MQELQTKLLLALSASRSSSHTSSLQFTALVDQTHPLYTPISHDSRVSYFLA